MILAKNLKWILCGMFFNVSWLRVSEVSAQSNAFQRAALKVQRQTLLLHDMYRLGQQFVVRNQAILRDKGRGFIDYGYSKQLLRQNHEQYEQAKRALQGEHARAYEQEIAGLVLGVKLPDINKSDRSNR